MVKRGFSGVLIITMMVVILLLMLSGCHIGMVAPANGCESASDGIDFCFQIENSNDYPDFVFYYEGGLDEGEFFKITELTGVDKMNNRVKIYATDFDVKEEWVIYDESIRDGVSSGDILLRPGKTVFRITSFDTENKKMVLELKE